jgi:GTP-binding protein HflX
LKPRDRSAHKDKTRIGPVRGASAASGGAPTRALVILPDRGRSSSGAAAATTLRTPESRLTEAVGLAEAIRLDIAATLIVPLRRPVPATLIGTGKVEEIAALVRVHDAELVIVDHPLTPVQQRNLEKAWSAKVLDRTGLILEIFGDRAQTSEGRLQVELAHLTYQKGRLVRSWTHLERQRGGFGFLGGPGETQIEADRRWIQARIDKIEAQLERVSNMRGVQRVERRRSARPIAALVGYTNAGKSTLFNRLTGAEILAEDMLFATLDPTLRRVRLPHGEELILSDTVGFISELPTMLVAAFRATLEEVVEADLILHVRDIASPDSAQQAEDVMRVLGELGVHPGDRRILEVWNQIDRLGPAQREALRGKAQTAEPPAVLASALTGEGTDALLATIEQVLTAGRATVSVVLEPAQLGAAPWLYENTEVLGRRDDPDTGEAQIDVRIVGSRQSAFSDWARRENVRVAVPERGRPAR